MFRSLSLLSTGLTRHILAGILMAAAAVAQCVGGQGVSIGTGDDTTFTPHYPLGFSMPMAGSALGTYTHFRLSCNGWLILTDGVTTPAGIPSGYGSSTILAGLTAGYSPRIAPFWRDVTVNSTVEGSNVNYDVTTNPGVSCRIQWFRAADFGTGGPFRTFEAELYATGDVTFRYENMNVVGTAPAYVGLSRGNAQTTVAASDLSAGGASAGVGMVWESFATGTFDLGAKSMTFTPDGLGGWNWSLVDCASHTAYNKGCYSVPNSVYQLFPDAAVASAALTGNAVTFLNTGTGYVATWIPGGAAGYVAPGGGATSLPLSDDGTTTIVPSVPLTVPGGSAPSLTIEHNGNIIAGTANHSGDWTPDGGQMTAALNRGFYSWHDFNNAETGSGPIQWEEVTVGFDQVLYVTWNGVENYPGAPTVNPSTMQFQVNLTTGTVTVLWVAVDTDITPGTGTSYLVGYTAAGAGSNPGSTNLSLGAVSVPETEQLPLTLAASPAPTFTLGGSSVPITYTTSNLQDLSPAFPGVYLAAMAFSINTLPPGPGFDLTFIGLDAPGCDLNVATIDVYYPISPTAATHNEVIVVPQPLSPGDTFYVQSVCFFIPNQLPNGQNNVGIITSNGIRSYFQTF
jgi:hypothetical protein